MTLPRDRLGRPLPWGTPDEEPPVPDDVARSDEAAWAATDDYLARGLPFHAHEACELRWRAAPEATGTAWRALAQWGAALTHEARGNAVGARRLAARALDTLDAAVAVPTCVDERRVRTSCAELLSRDSGPPESGHHAQ